MDQDHADGQQEPQRQGMRCEIHGVYFNPELTLGCVLCQREAAEEKRSPRAIPLTVAVLSVVLVALFVTAQMRRSGPPNAQADDTLEQAHSTLSGKLDPAPFRREIEALEKILYEPAPSGFGTADRLSSAAMDLAAGMRSAGPGPGVSRAMTRVTAYASRVGAEADAGYTTLDLPGARQRWEALRGEVFLAADWFRTSGPELTDAQTRKPPPLDRRLLSALKDSARDMELLIVKGRPEADAFGEPYVDAPENSAQLRQLGRQWNRWSRDWSAQLDRLGRRFPAQPPLDGDARLLNVYNLLTRAMQSLRSLPHGANDSGIPFRARRKSLFDQAQSAIDQAQAVLAELD